LRTIAAPPRRRRRAAILAPRPGWYHSRDSHARPGGGDYSKREDAMVDRRSVLGIASLLPAAALFPTEVAAASALEIDAGVDRTLREFSRRIGGAQELLAKSAAVLVFPSVIKAGMGIGGEYGEGALLVAGRTAGYYNTIAASIGFQLGAQARSVIIVFMTEAALDGFRRIDGWKVGVDGSVALVTVGLGGSIDTSKVASPIVGFIFDGKGLMYNLTLEGSKISRINR
jgi:lipid-binding SYLF domain-containing protein